ncbi:MAG TPA: family 10 glycosylhydrolase [Vicinamibacteria bacterium]|nr:family 10 glycosylhydrolase [Vicinamibacteria bacterium]
MLSRRAPALLACALLTSGPAPRPAAAAPASPAPTEVRGLWVIRTALVSPTEVDRVVDAAAAAGFNALFVQVRGRGDAFYRSTLAPRSPLLERQPRDFDPLARLLARAHVRRLAVHAWVNVLLAAHFGQPLPPGHVLGRHPEWAMVPKSAATAALVATGARRLQLVMEAGRAEGDVEGYYLSPSVPAVGSHLEAVVRELVGAYAVDGLHLDFVRYPGPSYDHSLSALQGFHTPARGELLGAPARDPAGWDAYRREVLTRLVARLGDAARTARPGLLVSAAVTPDEAQAVHHKGQDWPHWLDSRLVAVVCPMAYTSEERVFQQQLEAARARAGDGQRVWAGIGAYRLDPEELVERVLLARQAGSGGVVVFSHESLEPEHLRRLREEAFSPRPGQRDGVAHGAGSR